MSSCPFRASFSILALSACSVFAGCAAQTGATDDSSEDVLQSAEALSTESTASDPVEDAVLTEGDVDEASSEAAEQDDAPAPLDVGCGLRRSFRDRVKDSFDKNNDGKLDASERADLKDALGNHPRMKLELAKIGIKARHAVFTRLTWAYDVDGNGSLDTSERAALASAVEHRCEERRERVLASFDADNDGKLDDGELRAALLARVQSRVAKIRAIAGKLDTNGDGKLDEGERAAVRADLRARYLARRAEVKAKFDVNGDGKLDDAEIAALKAAIRARFESEAPGE